MFIYNAALDKIMFLNVLRTDTAEVKDLLNTNFILIFIGLGLLPAWLIYKTQIVSSPIKKQIISILCALLVTVLITVGNLSTTRQFLDSNRNLRYYLRYRKNLLCYFVRAQWHVYHSAFLWTESPHQFDSFRRTWYNECIQQSCERSAEPWIKKPTWPST